jgi:hypothetical protein
MWAIGTTPGAGFYTKTEMKRGKIASPGSRNAVGSGGTGDVKEYVSVKIAAGTYISGMVVVIDGDGVATTGTTPPDNLVGGRLGVLCLKDTAVTTVAAATLTAVGTCFAWAQIYGKALAQTSVSVTPNQALTLGTNGTLQVIASNSASAAVIGIQAVLTGGVAQLASVFLNYPHFGAAGAS